MGCVDLAPIARECIADHGLMARVHPVCICYAAQSRSRTVRAIIRPRCLGDQDVISNYIKALTAQKAPSNLSLVRYFFTLWF